MAVTITSENFETLVGGDKLVVIDFWAQWCGPCKALGPTVEEIATEYDGQVVVGKCDVDENNDIAMQFGVMNIPMLVFVKNGELVDTLVGRVPKEDIVKKIEANK
ncbi:MAG: thioredoxin [Bacteroidales bacterium]|nr:thioredoxin [Bacteroidales bacterium]